MRSFGWAVPDMAAARAVGAIREQISIPLVVDIHFDYRLALEAVAAGADKVRINPGNIGAPERVKAVAQACRVRGSPSVSESTVVPWKNLCWPNMEALRPRPWWSRLLGISSCYIDMTLMISAYR